MMQPMEAIPEETAPSAPMPSQTPGRTRSTHVGRTPGRDRRTPARADVGPRQNRPIVRIEAAPSVSIPDVGH